MRYTAGEAHLGESLLSSLPVSSYLHMALVSKPPSPIMLTKLRQYEHLII